MSVERDRVVAIIQARMGSSRLPGKTMLALGGKPIIEHVVERARASETIDKVIVATTCRPEDTILANWCEINDVQYLRGSTEDVLERYKVAATVANADIIVRLTGDCPLLDPEIINKVVRKREEANLDLCGMGQWFPDGLDCSVFTRAALEYANREARLKSDREHVTPYIERNPDRFSIDFVRCFQDKRVNDMRFTLDEEEDYKLLTRLYQLLPNKDDYSSKQTIHTLMGNADLMRINSHIGRNEGYKKSISLDTEAD